MATSANASLARKSYTYSLSATVQLAVGMNCTYTAHGRHIGRVKCFAGLTQTLAQASKHSSELSERCNSASNIGPIVTPEVMSTNPASGSECDEDKNQT
jgi:hypothetical protein